MVYQSQATGAGLSIFLGGAIRDMITQAAHSGILGDALNTPVVGYSVVYQIEIALLFITLIALGPILRTKGISANTPQRLELTDFPT